MVLAGSVFLIAFGLVAGIYGTIIGAGGGFLIVPMLIFGLAFAPPDAAGTSLLAVLFNAISATASFHIEGRIDVRTAVAFSLATLPGSIVGAFLSNVVSFETFNFAFAIILILSAGLLTIRPEASAASAVEEGRAGDRPRPGEVTRRITDARGRVFTYSFTEWQGIVLSFFVGIVSSLFGVGGGILITPAMVVLFGFPTLVAAATAQFIVAVTALSGVVSHFNLGNVDITVGLLLSLGTVVGAQIGAALSRRLHGRLVRRLLSLALLGVAARLLIG